MSLMFDVTSINHIPIYNILKLVPVNEYNEEVVLDYENKKVIISYYRENTYLISYITKKHKYSFEIFFKDNKINSIEADYSGSKLDDLVKLFDESRSNFYQEMDRIVEKIQNIVLLNVFHMVSSN